MVHRHFFLLTFPAQGHINLFLQFANCLIHFGAHVTLTTSLSAHRHMKSPAPDGLSFANFSDGYDDGFKFGDDRAHYMSQLRCRGSKALAGLIVSSANASRPVTCVVYSLLPWAAIMARELNIPLGLLWIQPVAVLDIYYYYFNGYGDVISNTSNEPFYSIELLGLPLLTSRDLPSFMHASNTYNFALPLFQEQLEELENESTPRILVNTFDALEPEALRAIGNFTLIGIGPLNIPSAFFDRKDPSNTSFGGALFEGFKDYVEWLNSKPESSVIYVSFGSISVLKKQQMEEIARGLLDCGLPFLWVTTAKANGEEEKEEDQLSCRDELEQKGMIVPWCSQVEVLSHPSLGCFVTHCWWNSTLESLVFGAPVVVFPQWTDQQTNVKLIEDVWKTGVRVTADKDGIVEGDEIKRCFELVIEGERGQEMRRNATKWKDLARAAVKEGGFRMRILKLLWMKLERVVPKRTYVCR